MAWETITPIVAAVRQDDKPKVSLTRATAGHQGAEMCIRLSEAVLRALGNPAKGAKLHVQRGFGDDDGWLRISKDARPAPDGVRRDYTIRSQSRGRPWVGFVAWPECGTKSQYQQSMEWEPDGKNAVKIKLPTWATLGVRFRDEPAELPAPAVRGLVGGNGNGARPI